MGKIGRFHPFIPYIVLLRTQKTLYIVIYPFVTALKSLGLTAVSVQIRSRAPKILRGIYKNASLFCYKTTLGNDWGIKRPVFKGFMNNYECSVLTLKKIGE